jgi:hypothetical protein
MFQVKNIIISFFVIIATAISATNATVHRSMIEGKSCLISGSSTACPDGYNTTNTTNGIEVAGHNVCCLTNGDDMECGDTDSSTPLCASAKFWSGSSTQDTSSAGSASIFALTASSIITPFVIMLMN